VDLAVHTNIEAVVRRDGHNPLALENDDNCQGLRRNPRLSYYPFIKDFRATLP
jgi:hypothetical protein